MNFSENARQVMDKVFLNENRKPRNDTVDIRNVTLRFDPHEEYLDYGKTSPTSRKYAYNELQWYKSQDLSIKGHQGIESNKIWKSCATEHGKINSNYGYLVFSEENYSQYKHAIKSLIDDVYTRQSVIIYTRPSLQIESKDGIHANHDFICTMYTQQFIENDMSFDYYVYMRSNDVIFGLKNDYSWHRYVYFEMFNELKKKYTELRVGNIIWHSGSMHIYKCHYDLMNKILEEYKIEKV